jgi:CMP-N-acetylneuraminic acid synthetase|tara:strand:- start:348 stop:542 length:195 start_codon:yes stop_codon:yes gene_type:complete
MFQKLPASFLESGTFLVFKTNKYILSKSIIQKNTTSYLLGKYKWANLNSKDDLKFLKVAFRTFN